MGSDMPCCRRIFNPSPSGPGTLCSFSPSNSLATPFGSTVMYPMGENGLAPLEGGSESPSRVKADWNKQGKGSFTTRPTGKVPGY